MLRRLQSIWLAVALVLVVTACGSGTDGADPHTTTTASSATTTEPASTTVAPEPTTTTTFTAVDLDDLPPCTEDMGSTSQLPDETDDVDRGLGNRVERVGWWGVEGYPGAPGLSGFDWNQDGNPDQVTVNRDNDTITLTWTTGSLTVTGVRTDFEGPVEDALGRSHGLAPADVGGSADDTVPVAVADVTGDGWLDLIVVNMGTVSVLAGAGDATPTGELPFESLGVETLGWQSPPVRMLGPKAADGSRGPDQIHPWPNALPSAVADLNGDGVQDFVVYEVMERSGGFTILFLGRPCTTASN